MDDVFHQVWAVAARRTAETKFASPLRQNHIVILASDAGSACFDLSRGVAPMAGFAASRRRCNQARKAELEARKAELEDRDAELEEG